MGYLSENRRDRRAKELPGRERNNRKVTPARKLQLHRNYTEDQVSEARSSVERYRRLRSVRNIREM